ncbi:MAG: hypothetical protein HC906_06560 [Bacteroidales bacterium]|nr:hypothetical protein [Bacteroidales bacterium]
MKEQLISILPLMVLAGSALIVLLIITFVRNHLLINLVTMLAYMLAMLSIVKLAGNGFSRLWFFSSSGFRPFILILLLFASFIITLFSYSYLEVHAINKEEYYVLLLTASLGACSLVMSDHFIIFFLSLELLSVSLFILIGYLRLTGFSIEAALKYLIISAASSSFLLLGMAFIFHIQAV